MVFWGYESRDANGALVVRSLATSMVRLRFSNVRWAEIQDHDSIHFASFGHQERMNSFPFGTSTTEFVCGRGLSSPRKAVIKIVAGVCLLRRIRSDTGILTSGRVTPVGGAVSQCAEAVCPVIESSPRPQ